MSMIAGESARGSMRQGWRSSRVTYRQLFPSHGCRIPHMLICAVLDADTHNWLRVPSSVLFGRVSCDGGNLYTAFVCYG